MRETFGLITKLGISQPQPACNFQLRLNFTHRSASYVEELPELTSVQSPLTLGNVAWD